MNQDYVTELQLVNLLRFSFSIFWYSVPIAVYITYLVFEQLLSLTTRLIYVEILINSVWQIKTGNLKKNLTPPPFKLPLKGGISMISNE